MSTSSTTMPTFGSRVKIKRPTTTNESGEPTNNCLFDAKRVLRLIEDERYLTAQALHQSIRDRIQSEFAEQSNSSNGKDRSFLFSKTGKRSSLKRQKSSIEQKTREASDFLDENKEIIKRMEDRCRLFAKARSNLNNDADWTMAQHIFGVTTYYRHESDRSMSIKLEGPVDDCSLFEQVAVMREFDLNYTWAPFVSASMTIAHLDKLDLVGWFLIGLPNFGLSRDALFRAIGCDSTYEDGNILIVGQGIADRPEEDINGEIERKDGANNDISIKNSTASSFGSLDYEAEENRILDELREDPILDTLDLPSVSTHIGGGRLTIRSVAAQIKLNSPSSSTVKLVMNVDPNLHFIPQPLLDFVMKRMCGTILNKLQVAAKNISKYPITNLHAIRIREDKDFYKTFLLPKFEGLCKARGWEMPPIPAFDLSDAQLEMADVFLSKQRLKSEKKTIEHLNVNASDIKLGEYLESTTSPKTNGTPFENGGDSEHAPKVRTMQNDSDDMSDISKFSTASSFWRSNPISNYKRQLDERAQLRKNREIEESRERAARRLKPKSLNEDAVERLRELRSARNRRKARADEVAVRDALDTKSGKDATLNDLSRSGRRLKISLRSHGFFTKVFVLQFLLTSLFCLLYIDSAFEKVAAVQGGSFWTERERDAATLSYIIVAGVVHSLFCYVAMIYAFSALQIGSIAGKRTRKFYSHYVHYAVGISSASMVGIGIIKPGFDKALRWAIWRVYSVSTVAETILLAKIPTSIIAALELVASTSVTLISSTQELFLESNILGRFLVSTARAVFEFIFRSACSPFAAYADLAIKQYEGDLHSLPWREDFFLTTRALLSYSAFFLSVMLFLFDAAAKKARRAIYKDGGVSSNKSSTSIVEASAKNMKETEDSASM